MKTSASVLLRQSAPAGVDWKSMPLLARALLLARASVLPLTVVGSGQGLLYAWWKGSISDTSAGVSGLLLGLAAFIGANLAHAANNLANDWRDYHDGLDRPGYPRADYSPHPIASGAMSSRTLFLTIAIITGLAALLGGFLQDHDNRHAVVSPQWQQNQGFARGLKVNHSWGLQGLWDLAKDLCRHTLHNVPALVNVIQGTPVNDHLLE